MSVETEKGRILASVLTENQELQERIHTLESACEAALKWFANEPGLPRDSQIVKQLEGAIKHG